jgi:hypothetical protein
MVLDDIASDPAKLEDDTDRVERVSCRDEMTKHYHQLIALILAAVLITACTSAPTPTSTPTAVPPVPTVTVLAPTNPPPTVAPTTVPPAPTVLPATATNPLPTTVPPTEEVETEPNQEYSNAMEGSRLIIQIGDTVLIATLVENSSVEALKETLSEGPITVNMRDYGGMEKVGSLGMDLPRNDEQITTEAGDLILYQGNAFVIYYAPNSWNFTRLGKIDTITPEELREILGDGSVTITLSLPQE